MREFGAGERWSPQHVFTSLDLDLGRDEPTTFEYRKERLRYACVLSRHAGAQRLFVSICSSIVRRHVGPPGFERFRFADRFGGHVLAISDPTLLLSSSLELSCGLGTREEDPVPGFVDVATAVAAREGIDPTRIIYWAHSAAAFAAGQAAARAPAGRAVLVNPLLDLPAFRRHGASREILRVAGFRTAEEGIAASPLRLSLTRAIDAARRDGRQPRLVLAQNRQDPFFWERQYRPFCRTFDVPEEGGFDPTGCIEAVPFDSDRGHSDEPPEVRDAIVRHHLPA